MTMTTATMLKRPAAYLPLAMSSVAGLAVVYHLARFGTAPQADEGAAAHVWQLLMALQLPLVAFFAIKWLPAAPRAARIVLALQLVAMAAAVAPVALLGW